MAVQAATAVMMAFKDTETGTQPATAPNQQKIQRHQSGGLVLQKPNYNWDGPDRYVKLLNF